MSDEGGAAGAANIKLGLNEDNENFLYYSHFSLFSLENTVYKCFYICTGFDSGKARPTT